MDAQVDAILAEVGRELGGELVDGYSIRAEPVVRGYLEKGKDENFIIGYLVGTAETVEIMSMIEEGRA